MGIRQVCADPCCPGRLHTLSLIPGTTTSMGERGRVFRPWGTEGYYSIHGRERGTERSHQKLGGWENGASTSLAPREALQKILGMDLRTLVSPLGPWHLLLFPLVCSGVFWSWAFAQKARLWGLQVSFLSLTCLRLSGETGTLLPPAVSS